jgi:hypothetical protein
MDWLHQASPPNYRAALGAGRAICSYISRCWPGASERERSA